MSKQRLEDQLKQFWFCPECEGILRPQRGLSGHGKFVVSREKAEIAIKNAINQKKINPTASGRAFEISKEYFTRSKLNQVQLRGVKCGNCGFETVTLTLSFKFDNFTKETMSLPYSEQVKLYHSGFSKAVLCSNCGNKTPIGSIYCLNCGKRIEKVY